MVEIETLKTLTIEQVRACTDADLLDLVYKLLLSESSDQLLDTCVV